MTDIRKHCEEIAADVQSLSHQLHSSKLEDLGLATAVRGFCADFSKLKKVTVAFIGENIPNPLPNDVSLCLFRVVQESLHNALKHSGDRNFAVTLRGTPGQLQLEVRDFGTGFDMGALRNKGLGLVSMQERINMVHGTFHVESAPEEGTRIVATVPVAVDDNASQRSEPLML